MSNKKKQMLDIARNKIAGKCDMKCSYNFAYSSSSISGNKDLRQGSLTIKYDDSNVPPVKYNGNKYKVSKVMMVLNPVYKIQGSLEHLIFGITHTPVVEVPPLIVLIPITTNPNNRVNSSGKILSNLLTDVNKSVAGRSGSFSLNHQFNLQDIVPNKPFYSTTQHGFDVILYDLEGAIIVDGQPLIQYVYSWMGNDDKIFDRVRTSGNFLETPFFYNSNGPNSSFGGGGGAGSDDVYIDCKPVNVDEEREQVKMDKYKVQAQSDYLPTRKNMIRLFRSPVFQGVLVLLFILIVYHVVKMALKYGKPTQDMGA